MAKILLIEDDPMVRYAIGKYLRRQGHEVVEAEDGRKGLKAAAEARPDLVICDVIMPRKEGIETLMEIKKATPNLPVVVISGGGRISSLDYLESAKAMGADAVFSKPIDEPALVEAIDRLLAGGPQ